jgi:hypothetical protein
MQEYLVIKVNDCGISFTTVQADDEESAYDTAGIIDVMYVCRRFEAQSILEDLKNAINKME